MHDLCCFKKKVRLINTVLRNDVWTLLKSLFYLSALTSLFFSAILPVVPFDTISQRGTL
jgi:hypothetical protein